MEDNPAAGETNTAPTAQHIVRACDICRKKKIRCEPTGDACLQCIKYKTPCHFTPVSHSRKPRRPAGHKHVTELEERLRRMESLLHAAVDEGWIQKRANLTRETPYGLLESKQNQKRAPSQPEELPIPESAWTRVTPPSETPISPPSISSNFQSLFGTPPQTPTTLSQPSVTSYKPSPIWKGDLVREIFSRRAFRELPSKPVALILIDESFRCFNSSFPIFDQNSFLASVQQRYSDSGLDDPGWWASLNVVLALAHRFRAMQTLDNPQEDDEAWGYVQNALAVVSELTMLHNSLPAIQALLGMTIILQGTPSAQLCSVLIAAAMRLAQTMGLHRKNRDPRLSEREIEQRKRVFWITYTMDKDISLRTGQPPAQDDEDMDVDLPSHTISNLPLDGNGSGSFNFFTCRIGLAIIQGQVYKRLYSAKAARQSETEQLLAVQELNSMLVTWRSGVPIDFGEDGITTLQHLIFPDILHKIILRLTYVNCLITIHRPFPDNQYFISPFDDFCANEARKAVRLIQITPRGDYACVWILLHYFLAAVTTLLHNVLRNPSHASARSDIQLVDLFLGLLELLANEGKSEEVNHMYVFCQDLNVKARASVEEVNMKLNTRATTSESEKESVEEFIMRVECQSKGCPVSGENLPTGGPGPGFEPWEGFSNGFNDLDMLGQ